MSEDRQQQPASPSGDRGCSSCRASTSASSWSALDFVLLSLALWISISIRYNTTYVPRDWITALVLLSGPVISVMTFSVSGLYRFVTRYLGYRGHTRIIGCIWLSVLVWSLVVLMSGQLGIPRSVVLGYGVLATLLIAGSREVAGMILESAGIRLSELPTNVERTPVIIFGAGQLGVQLLDALRRTYNRNAVAFVDTEPSLWRQYVFGPQGPPSRQAAVADRAPRRQGDPGRAAGRSPARAPPHPQGSAGPAGRGEGAAGARGDRLGPRQRHRPAADRGRGSARPRPGSANADLLARKTRGKAVMITGAGGSIGSELVRQLLKHGPSAARAVRDVGGRALRDRGGDRRVCVEDAAAGRAAAGDRRACSARCSTASWCATPSRQSASR